MFYICVCAKLAVYPKLLLSLTLYSVLENIMHPCAIRGIEDMNTWKYVMSVIYHTTRNHSKPAFGLFCTGYPLTTARDSLNGVNIQGLQSGTVGLTHRVRYSEKFRQRRWTSPRTRQYRKKCVSAVRTTPWARNFRK